MAHREKKRQHHKVTHSESSWSGFGDFGGILDLKRAVKPVDVGLGALIGLAGGALLKFGLLKSGAMEKMPAGLAAWAGPISSALAGLVAFLALRGSYRDRAEGILVGAAVAGALPGAWRALGALGPKFDAGDGVELPVFSDYTVSPYGVLTEDALAVADYVESQYGALTEDAVVYEGLGFSDVDDEYEGSFVPA